MLQGRPHPHPFWDRSLDVAPRPKLSDDLLGRSDTVGFDPPWRCAFDERTGELDDPRERPIAMGRRQRPGPWAHRTGRPHVKIRSHRVAVPNVDFDSSRGEHLGHRGPAETSDRALDRQDGRALDP